MTVLEFLLGKYPTAKRQTLKRMVEAGRVRINGKRAATLKQVFGPDEKIVVIDRAPPKFRKTSSGEGLAIIYEDADLLVVDKPPGLLTSTVARERRPTLLAMVRACAAQREPRATIGLIHRLDRDASGLLIFSKNDAAFRSLKSQFFHHTVIREYRAIVHGRPEPDHGRIENRLVERADGTVYITRQAARGELAISEYQVLETIGRRSSVRIVLHTGRKHQIRVHLAAAGTPVVGDKIYGPPGDSSRLMLAAIRITINHPRTGHPMTFVAPLPPEFSHSAVGKD